MTDPNAPTPVPPEVSTFTKRSTDLPPNAPWWALWIEANAKQAWRWASIQLPIVYSGLMIYYATNQDKVHEFVQANIPAKYWPWIGLAACLLQIVSRVVKLPRKGEQQ